MKKQIILSFVIALIFFAVGFLTCYLSLDIKKLKSPANNLVNSNDNYQAGWAAAKKRLVETGAVQPIEGEIVKSIMGKVESINNNTVTIKINVIDPLSDPNLDEREITINNDTKINKIVKKDQAEYQAELEQFKNSLKGNKNNDGQQLGPSEYKTIEISKSDLSAGQMLVVDSEDNIKELKSFVAKDMVVQYQP